MKNVFINGILFVVGKTSFCNFVGDNTWFWDWLNKIFSIVLLQKILSNAFRIV